MIWVCMGVLSSVRVRTHICVFLHSNHLSGGGGGGVGDECLPAQKEEKGTETLSNSFTQ